MDIDIYIFFRGTMSNLYSIEGESSPCAPKSSKFTVVYYNPRSLIPKMDELRIIVESQRPSVICVVETWLSEEVSDQEISLSEYQVTRLDRNRHGGGIVITQCNLCMSFTVRPQ